MMHSQENIKLNSAFIKSVNKDCNKTNFFHKKSFITHTHSHKISPPYPLILIKSQNFHLKHNCLIPQLQNKHRRTTDDTVTLLYQYFIIIKQHNSVYLQSGLDLCISKASYSLWHHTRGSLSNIALLTYTHIYIYRVEQEEWTKLREGVPYVKLYRKNPKHLYPKLNGYGDNGQR